MDRLYELLFTYNFNEALRESKTVYKPSNVGKGFFMRLSDDEILRKVKIIRFNDVLATVGFTEDESHLIRTIFCTFYLAPIFDLEKKLAESVNNIKTRLVKSRKIVNKDIPFYDLKCLLTEGKVYKKK